MDAFKQALGQIETLALIGRFSSGWGWGRERRGGLPAAEAAERTKVGKTQALAWFFTAVSN